MTKNGTDPLLSAEENCADLIEPPTESEMDHAITGNMGHLLVVMKAVKRFKRLITRKRPPEGIFGRESRLVTPPHAIRSGGSRSQDNHDRRPMDQILVTAGVHRDVDVDDEMQKLPHELDKAVMREPDGTKPPLDIGVVQDPDETKAHSQQRQETATHHPHLNDDPEVHRRTANDRSFTFPVEDHAKGHAHDPLMDTLFLDIGATTKPLETRSDDPLRPIVSESPPAIEMNIYEQAYQEEMKRIMEHKGEDASMYLTRRMDHRQDLRSHSNIMDSARGAASSVANKFGALASKGASGGGGGLAAFVKQAREQAHADSEKQPDPSDEGAEKGKEQGGEDGNEDPPLKAPHYDGADDDKAETTEPTADTLSQLDAHKGAMPGMPGGFPLSPGIERDPE